MLLNRNKKNNVYPYKPLFYYIKVGFKGVKIIQACFCDASSFWSFIKACTIHYINSARFTDYMRKINRLWLHWPKEQTNLSLGIPDMLIDTFLSDKAQISILLNIRAPEKAFLSIKNSCYFSYFSMKTYIVGSYWKCLVEALPMSTHNICFHGKIRKNIFGTHPSNLEL